MARTIAIFEAIVGESGQQLESDVERVVFDTLEYKLPRELDELFGLRVGIRIRGKRHSSLHVFFEAFMLGFTLLSGYKGIFDSVELIRQQAELLLARTLPRYQASVSVQVGSTRWHSGRRLFLIEGQPWETWGVRDGFFYFLLILSLEELAVIAFLVYHVVATIYLGSSALPVPPHK